MKKLFYKAWSRFLTTFGDIKIFHWPLWIIYDPDDYQIAGENVKEIMDLIRPGDIILRGYRHYLDGKFIPNFPNDEIGKGFSHGAIYVGEDKIIHAVAQGVSEINVIDFCQCDRIAVFRPKRGAKTAVKIARSCIGKEYDFDFESGNGSLYCFELCKKAYPKLDIKPVLIKRFFGLVKKTVYVAQSIIDSPDCDLVYCANKDSGIYFKAS